MTPFAIAGIQMHVLPERNIDGIRQRLKLLMHYYPWVEMVLLSELAPFGSSLHYAQRLPGPAEEEFQQMAREHGIWFVPGSLYENSRWRDLQHLAGDQPEGRGDRTLFQDVPLHAVRGRRGWRR